MESIWHCHRQRKPGGQSALPSYDVPRAAEKLPAPSEVTQMTVSR